MWEQSVGLGKGGGDLERAELTALSVTLGQDSWVPLLALAGGVQVAWRRIFPICQFLQRPGQVFAVWQHKKTLHGESLGRERVGACPMQSGGHHQH